MKDFKNDTLPAIIGIGGVLLSVVVFILSAKTESRVLAVIGLILFVLAIVAGKITEKAVVASYKEKNVGRMSEGSIKKTTSKYQQLIMDERTKQDPDVQRLLQYLSVQKAFFNPDYIHSSAAQNDPYVRELIEVFDRMLGNGGANGDFVGYADTDPMSAYAVDMNKREIEQRERKRPRKIAGKIMVGIGVALFMLPFFSAFFNPLNSNALYFMGAAPFGMLLIVIGKIIK